MMGFVQEFKAFAMRGNVIDLAVGVIIGASFGKITSSLVSDVLMPPIGLLLGRVDFSELYLDLSGAGHASLAAAKEAGAPTINYGIFTNQVIDFLILAFAIFLMIKFINKLKAKDDAKAAAAAAVPVPTTKDCPKCYTAIPIMASRCPNCTSELGATA